MNLQQYLALKQELAASITFMQALAAEMDRLKEELHDLRQSLPRPVGRPRKENGEIATV
jgi:cell division protein FtsB